MIPKTFAASQPSSCSQILQCSTLLTHAALVSRRFFIHLLSKHSSLYVFQPLVETTCYVEAVTVAAVLGTLGLPEVWICNSHAAVDSILLGCDSVLGSTPKNYCLPFSYVECHINVDVFGLSVAVCDCPLKIHTAVPSRASQSVIEVKPCNAQKNIEIFHLRELWPRNTRTNMEIIQRQTPVKLRR